MHSAGPARAADVGPNVRDPLRVVVQSASLFFGAQPGVQVRNQRGHLRVIKAPRECGHHALSRKNYSTHLFICRRCSAGKRGTAKQIVQIWRNFLKLEIVVAMAVRTTHIIEVLPFSLLRREFRRAMASNERRKCTNSDSNSNSNRETHHIESIGTSVRYA